MSANLIEKTANRHKALVVKILTCMNEKLADSAAGTLRQTTAAPDYSCSAVLIYSMASSIEKKTWWLW